MPAAWVVTFEFLHPSAESSTPLHKSLHRRPPSQVFQLIFFVTADGRMAIEQYLHILHDDQDRSNCTSWICRVPERSAWCSSCLPLPRALRSPYYRSSLCLHIHLVQIRVGVCADDAADAHEEPIESLVSFSPLTKPKITYPKVAPDPVMNLPKVLITPS